MSEGEKTPKVHTRSETVYQVKNPSISVERPEINSRNGLIFEPISPDSDPKSQIKRTPEGSPGRYKITFKLAIPGTGTFQKDCDFTNMKGECLLMVPRATTSLRVDISSGSKPSAVTLSWNNDGTLATAEITMNASSIIDAERQAYDFISPLLSSWSFKYDVALDISAYTVLEESTDVVKLVAGLVGKVKLLDLNDSFEAELIYQPLLSTYREALNATNVFYQVLCFYKVIEGVRKLRGNRQSKGLKNPTNNERIPPNINSLPFKDPLVLNDFRPFLGKKFTWVIDNHYHELLRNALAHLNPQKHILDADKLEDVSKCERAIMVLKYISREMLKNELSI